MSNRKQSKNLGIVECELAEKQRNHVGKKMIMEDVSQQIPRLFLPILCINF